MNGFTAPRYLHCEKSVRGYAILCYRRVLLSQRILLLSSSSITFFHFFLSLHLLGATIPSLRKLCEWKRHTSMTQLAHTSAVCRFISQKSVPLTSTLSPFINLFVSDYFCYPKQTLFFSVSDITYQDLETGCRQ